MNRRGVVAGAILVAWVGGLGLLVRREFFRPQVERLAEAAMRVNPGASYFAVLQAESVLAPTQGIAGLIEQRLAQR